MKDFTVIELVLVFSIILVLASIAIPTYLDYEDAKVDKEVRVAPKNDIRSGNLMSNCPIYPCDSNEN